MAREFALRQLYSFSLTLSNRTKRDHFQSTLGYTGHFDISVDAETSFGHIVEWHVVACKFSTENEIGKRGLGSVDSQICQSSCWALCELEIMLGNVERRRFGG